MCYLVQGMYIVRKIFKNNNTISLYWRCQFLGWGLVSIYWAYTVYSRDHYGYFLTFLNYILDILIGITLTHGYRFIALKLKWNSLNLPQLFRKNCTFNNHFCNIIHAARKHKMVLFLDFYWC